MEVLGVTPCGNLRHIKLVSEERNQKFVWNNQSIWFQRVITDQVEIPTANSFITLISYNQFELGIQEMSNNDKYYELPIIF